MGVWHEHVLVGWLFAVARCAKDLKVSRAIVSLDTILMVNMKQLTVARKLNTTCFTGEVPVGLNAAGYHSPVVRIDVVASVTGLTLWEVPEERRVG
jgi:hypothetical protein